MGSSAGTSAAKRELPRDAFIGEVFSAAKRDRNLYFLCCDLGAKALDRFREELPGQFIHAGISEQNMIDLAAGLALEGKTVYAYAMAPFVTSRCYEQIKVSVAAMGLPVCVVGVGAGFGYDDAGPTHYATEDLGCMRSLGNIEILTPSDTVSAVEAARISHARPAFRYIRLDRAFLPDVYRTEDRALLEQGLVEVDEGEDICLIAHGYMLQKAREARKALEPEGVRPGIADAHRIKPLKAEALARLARKYRRFATLEEHFLDAGLGSCVLEGLSDAGLSLPVLRIGLKDRYFFENGGRARLHELAGIDLASLRERLLSYARGLDHLPGADPSESSIASATTRCP